VQNALIFCNRKTEVDILCRSLTRHKFDVGALHGDMAQTVRFATLEKFKANDLRLLVCSDVAARGLDIGGLSHVFNFDVPHHAEDYVHRIGRTGRAGLEGHAFTIASPEDRFAVEAIEKLVGHAIPPFTVEGLDPVDWSEEDGRKRRRGRTTSKPGTRTKEPSKRSAEPKRAAEPRRAAAPKRPAEPRRAAEPKRAAEPGSAAESMWATEPMGGAEPVADIEHAIPVEQTGAAALSEMAETTPEVRRPRRAAKPSAASPPSARQTHEVTRGAPPREAPRNAPAREAVRAATPSREASRGAAPREGSRGAPPRDASRNVPSRDASRNAPPREAVRAVTPSRETSRGAPPRREHDRGHGDEHGPSVRGFGDDVPAFMQVRVRPPRPIAASEEQENEA
jgi:superfamily II DNA/RNA helicase